jgi:hypothetical protein
MLWVIRREVLIDIKVIVTGKLNYVTIAFYKEQYIPTFFSADKGGGSGLLGHFFRNNRTGTWSYPPRTGIKYTARVVHYFLKEWYNDMVYSTHGV